MDFDSWLSEQDEAVQGMIGDHIAGLRSALESERSERKGLQQQVKELAKESEAGSEMQQRLDKLAGELAATTTRSSFYEQAHGAGVRNLRLAYVAAREAGLLSEDGSVDLDALKADYGELFAQATAPQQPLTPRGNAGQGVGQLPPAPKTSMDDVLRQTAGVIRR